MNLDSIEGKRILLSPLNWGFGHVARCIDLVKTLDHKNRVFLAVDDRQKEVFRHFFPDLIYIEHDGYPFRFHGKGKFIQDLALSFFKLNAYRKKERHICTKLVTKHNIDLVISDHRFGFYSPLCKSVFLTHQTNLALPFPFSLCNIVFRKLMERFHEIWLVDDQNIQLSGKLTYLGKLKNVHFIGLLSRFKYTNPKQYEKKLKILLLSGPEVYWRHLLIAFKEEEIDVVISPKNTKELASFSGKYEIVLANDWTKTDQLLLQAAKIYSYCGYSSLMDFHYLRCSYKCIPCPGQYEQKYLSKKMAQET